MAVFALMKRAPSSASTADDTTAHMIYKMLRTAPLFVGMSSSLVMNMYPPTRLHALGSERYDVCKDHVACFVGEYCFLLQCHELQKLFT